MTEEKFNSNDSGIFFKWIKSSPQHQKYDLPVAERHIPKTRANDIRKLKRADFLFSIHKRSHAGELSAGSFWACQTPKQVRKGSTEARYCKRDI